jgi:acyl-CoA synthetase (AMP-forming)/AMP-acid ligase II
MKVANASIVVSTPDLTQHLKMVTSHIGSSTSLVVNLGSFPGVMAPADALLISPATLAVAPTTTSFEIPKRSLKDISCLIYTSGTSGKPKAVSIKNFQTLIVSCPLQSDIDNLPEGKDQVRIFSCLPLFHATCMFTGMLYGAGISGCFCLARKFSASQFSRSLYESGATRMLYVGELCRYLLKAAPSEYDRAHRCRTASGNGLQKDIWEPFMHRFGILYIREFYRSTEGVAKYDNFDGGKASVGRVGFEGPLAHSQNNITYLVKIDTENEEPWRDPKTGFCVPAKAGEPGEAIGRVLNIDFYNEYLNSPDANSKKLMADVFKKGDLFQRSGDLLVREKDGWIRFMDRAGDSYRWRGENVSAGEVREHISKIPGVQDVTVFGVVLEKYDGQAGCAAITLHSSESHVQESFIQGLYTYLRNAGLTIYQVPRLLRFVEA